MRRSPSLAAAFLLLLILSGDGGVCALKAHSVQQAAAPLQRAVASAKLRALGLRAQTDGEDEDAAMMKLRRAARSFSEAIPPDMLQLGEDLRVSTGAKIEPVTVLLIAGLAVSLARLVMSVYSMYLDHKLAKFIQAKKEEVHHTLVEIRRQFTHIRTTIQEYELQLHDKAVAVLHILGRAKGKGSSAPSDDATKLMTSFANHLKTQYSDTSPKGGWREKAGAVVEAVVEGLKTAITKKIVEEVIIAVAEQISQTAANIISDYVFPVISLAVSVVKLLMGIKATVDKWEAGQLTMDDYTRAAEEITRDVQYMACSSYRNFYTTYKQQHMLLVHVFGSKKAEIPVAELLLASDDLTGHMERVFESDCIFHKTFPTPAECTASSNQFKFVDRWGQPHCCPIVNAWNTQPRQGGRPSTATPAVKVVDVKDAVEDHVAHLGFKRHCPSSPDTADAEIYGHAITSMHQIVDDRSEIRKMRVKSAGPFDKREYTPVMDSEAEAAEEALYRERMARIESEIGSPWFPRFQQGAYTEPLYAFDKDVGKARAAKEAAEKKGDAAAVEAAKRLEAEALAKLDLMWEWNGIIVKIIGLRAFEFKPPLVGWWYNKKPDEKVGRFLGVSRFLGAPVIDVKADCVTEELRRKHQEREEARSGFLGFIASVFEKKWDAASRQREQAKELFADHWNAMMTVVLAKDLKAARVDLCYRKDYAVKLPTDDWVRQHLVPSDVSQIIELESQQPDDNSERPVVDTLAELSHQSLIQAAEVLWDGHEADFIRLVTLKDDVRTQLVELLDELHTDINDEQTIESIKRLCTEHDLPQLAAIADKGNSSAIFVYFKLLEIIQEHPGLAEELRKTIGGMNLTNKTFAAHSLGKRIIDARNEALQPQQPPTHTV